VWWAQLIDRAQSGLGLILAGPHSTLALASATLAAALIIVSAFVKTMIPLRWLAVGANVGFIAYGALAPAPMVLALHAVLLPVNLVRVVQMLRLTKRVRTAVEDFDAASLWLRPYMKKRSHKAGHVIFRAGDVADHLYLLVEGEVEIVERGRRLAPGRMFGEIAFFAPDRRRTSTARCATPCVLLSIGESALRELYYQNPEFGFELVREIAGRLTSDIRQLEERLAAQQVGADPGSDKDRA
jgi:CRP/FNR family cyclic AMP-dependent transcriptional regulator